MKSLPRRKSIRLQKYNYSSPGYYFITICTQSRRCLFGEIDNGKMKLNNMGKMVKNVCESLPEHHLVELDVFQIMPNHIHGIIFIRVGATLAVALDNIIRAGASPAPTSDTVGPNNAVTIGNIVGAFKSLVSNECLKIFKSQNEYMGKLWQRNYYEHIIRNENELNRIRKYIIDNPSSTSKPPSQKVDILKLTSESYKSCKTCRSSFELS